MIILNVIIEKIMRSIVNPEEIITNDRIIIPRIASKKINDVTNYTLAYQQKLFFNTYMRQKIRKAYTTFLIAQLANILQFSAQRQMFSAVKLYVKEEKQAAAIEKKV